MKKVYPNFWQALLLTPVVSGVILVLLALFFVVIHLVFETSLHGDFTLLLNALTPFVLLPIIVYCVRFRKLEWREKGKVTIRSAISFTIAGIFMRYAISTIHVFLFEDVSKGNSTTTPIVVIISLLVFAPVLEELFYRRIVLNQFLKRYNPLVAISLSAFLFAISHPQVFWLPKNIMHLMLAGCFFGYVYYKTESIVLAIIIHSLFNLQNIVLRNFADKSLFIDSIQSSMSSPYFIVGAFVFVVSGIAYVVVSERRKGLKGIG